MSDADVHRCHGAGGALDEAVTDEHRFVDTGTTARLHQPAAGQSHLQQVAVDGLDRATNSGGRWIRRVKR